MRHTRQRSLNSWLKAAATLCLLAAVAQACSVPVFRYALERWQADPYEVFVFHHGKLTTTQQAQVDRLTRDGEAGKTFANVRVKACDLDNNPDPDLLALWKNQETSQKITTPWMAVHYPVASRNPTPVWQGPLTDARVTALLKSPMRKTIADRLIQGHTSVFVLLESGNQAADDKAATLILARLAHLETNLKLPEISEEDIAQGLVLIDPEDLKVKFSLLRLSRKNAAETMFIEMLLSSEDDLREDTPQPMAFPIFGRGRALYALVGKGINNDTIDAAGADLTGPCTCTVKEQNPGIDMLMPVAWDQLVQRLPETDKPLPPLVGLTGFGEEPQDNNTDDLQNTGIQTTGEATQQAATTSDDSNNATDSKTDSKTDPQQHPEDSTTETSSGSTDNVGFLAMVTGLALVGIWLFVKRRG
jgi:hypothetical protein